MSNHDTILVGYNEDGTIGWCRTYDYKDSEKEQAQSDLIMIQEHFPNRWHIGEIMNVILQWEFLTKIN